MELKNAYWCAVPGWDEQPTEIKLNKQKFKTTPIVRFVNREEVINKIKPTHDNEDCVYLTATQIKEKLSMSVDMKKLGSFLKGYPGNSFSKKVNGKSVRVYKCKYV